MLRDIFSGLTLAAVTGALYALGNVFGPLNWKLGDDAFGLLVLVGIMLSVIGFFAEFIGSALNRRMREASAEIDERSRQFDESARASALRLNAYALAGPDCMAATDPAMVASEAAKVIPFPARWEHLRRPAIALLQGSA
jgi:hypothetical protein